MAPAVAAADTGPIAVGPGAGGATRGAVRARAVSSSSVAALYLVAALPVAVALHAWRGVSYWEYSEGVYALTARMLLEGSSLYSDVLAAQPPPLFYAAAGVLAVEDSIEALRAALAVPYLATGLLVALAVWRLTACRGAAVAAGVASLVTPWALHEQALLMPETFAAPLLMGAALLAASPRRSAWGGAAAALAGSFKLAFLLPLGALALAARARGRYIAGVLVALGVLWTVFLVTHGAALLENVLQAQWQTGRQSPRLLGGLWLQAAWNLLPLAALAALAWPARRRVHDRALLACLAALALGSAALVLSLVKHGSYLNVLALAEPPLVALAAAGVWARWRVWGEQAQRAGRTGEARDRARALAPRAGVVALVLLLAAQSASLAVSPGDPALFARPFSQAAHGWSLSGPGVERSVRWAGWRARTGRPELNPYIAFLARRPVPGGQPDRFILRYAAIHAEARRVALTEQGRRRARGRER